MKPLSKLVLSLLFSLSLVTAKAQDDLAEFLNGSVADANKLVEAYLAPGIEAMSTGLAGGWYNTAAPHKLGGFDLTISANLVYIPDDRLFYNAAGLNLERTALISPSNGLAPTVMGPDIEPEFEITSGPAQGETFFGPPGLDLKNEIKMRALPMPTVNLGIGFIKGTEFKVRYIPKIDDEDVNFTFWGVSVMHDVKQHIPKIKALPIDISIFGGYTKMKLETDLSGSIPGEDQMGTFNVGVATIQGLVSKKISVLTFYGGIGYNIITSKMAMEGWYDLDEDGVREAANNEVNPVNLEFPVSGARITAGMRLKLAFFTIHGDYTVQKYKVLSAGIGFSFR